MKIPYYYFNLIRQNPPIKNLKNYAYGLSIECRSILETFNSTLGFFHDFVNIMENILLLSKLKLLKLYVFCLQKCAILKREL